MKENCHSHLKLTCKQSDRHCRSEAWHLVSICRYGRRHKLSEKQGCETLYFFLLKLPCIFFFCFCRHLISLIFIKATCVIVHYWSDILQNKKDLTRWTTFCLAEIGCWGKSVCLHLHSGPSHLDQPAVLGSHFLQRGPESDPIPLSQHPRGERGHHCQAKGKIWK